MTKVVNLEEYKKSKLTPDRIKALKEKLLELKEELKKIREDIASQEEPNE